MNYRVEVKPGDSITVVFEGLPVAPSSKPRRSVIKQGYVNKRRGFGQHYVTIFSDGSNGCQCEDWYFNVFVKGTKNACYHVNQLAIRA